jgi:hypothetical protein
VVFTDYPLAASAPSGQLALDPATGHSDGQQVHVTGSNVPNSYSGGPFWIFPTTGEWVVSQCGAGVADDQSIGGVFVNCAPSATQAVDVQGGNLDAHVELSSSITGALGDEIDCTAGDGCVVALVRVETGGEVTILTAPLSFGAAAAS